MSRTSATYSSPCHSSVRSVLGVGITSASSLPAVPDPAGDPLSAATGLISAGSIHTPIVFSMTTSTCEQCSARKSYAHLFAVSQSYSCCTVI